MFEIITELLTNDKLLHLLPLKLISCFMSDSDGDSPLDALQNTDGKKISLLVECGGTYIYVFLFSLLHMIGQT